MSQGVGARKEREGGAVSAVGASFQWRLTTQTPNQPPNQSTAQPAADDPDLLRNRSIRDRTIVISAGVIANILFAYTSLFVQVRVCLLLWLFQGKGVTVSCQWPR